MYASGGRQGGHLHSDLCVRASRRDLLVSASPSFERRTLQCRVEGISTVLLARTRMSRLFKLSSVHEVGAVRKASVPLCSDPRTLGSIRQVFSCVFGPSVGKAFHPGLRLLPVGSALRFKRLSIAPIRIRRKLSHAFKCEFSCRSVSITCVPSYRAVSRTSVSGLRSLSCLVLSALGCRPRPARLSLSRTLALVSRVGTRGILLARVKRHFSRSALADRLVSHKCAGTTPTCSNLAVALWRGGAL